MLAVVVFALIASCKSDLFTATDTPIPVADVGQGSSIINIDAKGYIAHLNVRIVTNHPSVSEITFYLSNGVQTVTVFR